jgi:hypothetical protein
MAWRKVILSTTADQIVFVQNTSAIKNSIVRLAFTDTDREPDNLHGVFILSGPNTWNGRIKKGSFMWFEEQLGGVFTYTAYDIEPLKNYNIPTVHKDIKTNNDVIDVPEGAYFVIQNKSDESVYFSIVGQGKFVLTKNQMLSFTFTADTQVRITGTGQDVSYYYAEAPSLTQLSKETKTMLEDLKAAIELLKNNAVTRNELLEVHKKTYYDRYSKDISVKINTINPTDETIIAELPLLETDDDFDSEELREGEILDFIIAVEYDNNGEATESATNISARISKNQLMLPIIDMDTYDTVLGMILEEIKLEWNEVQHTLKPTVIFSNWINKNTDKYKNIANMFKAPITVKLRVKSELAVWKASDKTFVSRNTNRLVHTNNRFNKRVHFTTDVSYSNLFNDINRTKAKDSTIYSVRDIIKASKTNDAVTHADIYVFADTNDTITVKLIKKPDEVTIEVYMKSSTAVEDNTAVSSIIIENLTDTNNSIAINLDLLEKTKTPRIINKTTDPYSFGTSLYIPSGLTADIYSNLFDRFMKTANNTGIIKIITRKEN